MCTRKEEETETDVYKFVYKLRRWVLQINLPQI